MTIPLRRIVMAIILLAVAGVARLPFEQKRTRELQARGILEPPLNASLREELGQSFFIAVLGGFRSVVASLVELKTIQPWQEAQWGLVDEYYAICNRLQPREWHYWDQRAWHAGINASDHYRYEVTRNPALQGLKTRQAMAKAIAVVREGIGYCPDVHQLYERLRMLEISELNPEPDQLAAARACERGAQCPGAPPYLARFAAYHLAEVPGHELEAWRRLLAFYRSGEAMNRAPRVVLLLAVLEPTVKRLDPSAMLPPELEAEAPRLRALYRSRMEQLKRKQAVVKPLLPGSHGP